jgi:aerobic carbon-monoxide dehydrogenase medium subunit
VKPAPFAYHRPHSLAEALQLLAELGDETRPLAGGQSLVPMMNMRLARPEHLVDLNDLAELDFIREGEEAVEIGALVRHRAVERSDLIAARHPLLSAVARTIGHDAIRERGTVGGSLALADPSAQWPLLAVLLDARIDLASQTGRRSVRVADFFTGVFATAAAPGELIVAASFPKLAESEGWAYHSFARRHGDFAVVAAAATVKLDDDGRIGRARLALCGVADRPIQLDAVTDQFRARTLDAAAFGRITAAAVSPHGDAIASAAFRRDLVEVLSAEVLTDAVQCARTSA